MVTGGSQGIGEALARRDAREGAGAFVMSPLGGSDGSPESSV